jgi:Protein of unknown function (DUF3352)
MPTARRAELEKQRKHKQVRSLSFTAGAAALLVAGGTLAFFLINGRQSNGVIPLGATVIPQNALLSLTVSTDDAPWQKLGQFGTSESKAGWNKYLKHFETDFLEPFGLSYNKDIKGWMGQQLTMAMVSPVPEDATQVGHNTTVWVLPIRDIQQAQSVLSRMAGNGAGQKRTYKDVEVQTFQGSNGKTVSAFVLEGRLLIAANGNSTLNQVIDTYRGGPSLAQTPRFQDAMSTVEEGSAFAKLYVNLPMATAGALQDSGRGLSQSALERLQAVQGMGSTISIQDEGLNFKTVSWLKPNAKQELKGSNKVQTLARLLPSDTLAMISGGDFQQVWQDYSQGTESQLIVPFNPKKIQSGLQRSTGMDFEKEFVPWMNGEFAAAVVPSTDKSKQGVGLTVLVKASDRNKADQSFKKLDTALRDRHNFLVAESKVGNRSVTTWKVPPNLPLASHGWLDGDVAFFTFGAPITKRIVTPDNSALVNAELFKATDKTSLSSNSGHFFADLQRTTTLMKNSPLLPKLSPATSQYIQAMDGIGVTSSIQNSWSTRYDLFLKLKR